jgi:hypothetical protein
MKLRKILQLTLMLATVSAAADACTIFSGKDNNGHVWAGNNEDMVFTFNSYLNLVASSDTTLGYMYHSYFSPDGTVQGGVNEAGLFFDGNAVRPSAYKDYEKKKDFPGGSRLLFHHVLKTCKTVHEVFALFNEYRLSGLEAAQIHLADKFGNLGIIVADSMWITNAPCQISTNYNLCHNNKDGIDCWRFPIAERMLNTHEPGLDVFNEICDSTSRKTRYSTLYSTVHDLTTGEIWFFYGMDYHKKYKTSLNELLKNGSRSFFLYELFIEEPLVDIYKTYLTNGADEALARLNSFQLTSGRSNEILRLLVSDLIYFNRDFRSYPFLATLIRSQNKPDEFNLVLNAIALFCTGQKNDAIDMLKNYSMANPDNTAVNEFLNRMLGIMDENANARFELKGYANAQHVFVNGISISPIYNFLVKNGDTWTGSFVLPAGAYQYNFSVDGTNVTDPENSETVTIGNILYNKMLVTY